MNTEILKVFIRKLVDLKISGYISSKSYLAVANILSSNRIKKFDPQMQNELVETIELLLNNLGTGTLTNKEFRKTLKMVALLYVPVDYVNNAELYNEEEDWNDYYNSQAEDEGESPFTDISDKHIDNWNDYYSSQEEGEWESSFNDISAEDCGMNSDEDRDIKVYEELHIPSNEEYYAQMTEKLQNYADASSSQEENEWNEFEDLEENTLVGDNEGVDDIEDDTFDEFEDDTFEDIEEKALLGDINEDDFDDEDENIFSEEDIKDIEAKIKDLENTVGALDALTDYALDGDTTKIEELWNEKQGKKQKK